jgi:U3 small nucleolar RNA-associated protein 18
MAPVTTIPHKANNHQRYMPEKPKNASTLPSDVDLGGSDDESGALQPVSESKEPEWEGFGGEKEEEEVDDISSSEVEEESDDDSIDIQIETKKQEKPILPKDAEEEELERMIFGDSAGFKQGLEDFSLKRTAGAYGDLSDGDQDEEEDLEAVADQDLFFFDAGPVAAPAGSTATKAAETDDEDDKPAWDDSDDERLVVSLASVPQLRKLRDTAEDDMVNGKEYSRRLRRQYERLYPTPDWAADATGKANKKRRRTMDDDESGSASDMDMDEDDISSQPLAKLLKDADLLSRTSRGPLKRRKLQAGTVDIQRLKDVMKSGPVSVKTKKSVRCDANKSFSLPSLHFRSILPTRYFSLPVQAQHYTYITSTRIRQTRTHCSHHYTSNARRSSPPPSIRQLQTHAYSWAPDAVISMSGILPQARSRRCPVFTATNMSSARWRTSRYLLMASTWPCAVLQEKVAV